MRGHVGASKALVASIVNGTEGCPWVPAGRRSKWMSNTTQARSGRLHSHAQAHQKTAPGSHPFHHPALLPTCPIEKHKPCMHGKDCRLCRKSPCLQHCPNMRPFLHCVGDDHRDFVAVDAFSAWKIGVPSFSPSNCNLPRANSNAQRTSCALLLLHVSHGIHLHLPVNRTHHSCYGSLPTPGRVPLRLPRQREIPLLHTSSAWAYDGSWSILSFFP